MPPQHPLYFLIFPPCGLFLMLFFEKVKCEIEGKTGAENIKFYLCAFFSFLFLCFYVLCFKKLAAFANSHNKLENLF
jgi:hypothetical protein